MWLLRPTRVLREQQGHQRVREVEVRGLEHLRHALQHGYGVMIVAKHVGHADAFVFLAAGDRLRRPFYYMVGWQVLQLLGPLGRWALRWHGCFSVDRESYDVRAFRQAVDILLKRPNPLVVFAEGEIYHHSEHVFPFRTGAAAIARTAAKRSTRPIVCVPAAIRYRYVEDVMPKLLQLMDTLERRLGWQPRPELPLAQRLYRFAEGVLALKELEYLGAVQPGSYPFRTASLADTVVRRIEERHGMSAKGRDLPGRVTQLRHVLIEQLEGHPANDPRQAEWRREMEDLFVAIQLYSYTDDYSEEDPSLERMAEILDKYEEDVLGLPTANVRGDRRATIAFGAPVEVKKGSRKHDDVADLTAALEQAVQRVVDDLHGKDAGQPAGRPSPTHEALQPRDQPVASS